MIINEYIWYIVLIKRGKIQLVGENRKKWYGDRHFTQWRSYSSAKAFFDALEKCMMCEEALEFLKLFALFWICAHIYNKNPFSGIKKNKYRPLL